MKSKVFYVLLKKEADRTLSLLKIVIHFTAIEI